MLGEQPADMAGQVVAQEIRRADRGERENRGVAGQLDERPGEQQAHDRERAHSRDEEDPGPFRLDPRRPAHREGGRGGEAHPPEQPAEVQCFPGDVLPAATCSAYSASVTTRLQKPAHSSHQPASA